MPAYSVTLPTAGGQDFVSDEHLPLIVYFYPKDSTPGCTTEGLDFNARLPEFEKLGYTVVGISRDGVKSHQNFCTKQGFQFELLSDKDETVCKQFDVIKLKKLYGKESLGIERSTFVLDKNGDIAHEWRKVKVAGHAQEVLDTCKPISMNTFAPPVVLSLNGIRLEPLGPQHEAGLRAAAADGELWQLVFTSVPEPAQTAAYIQTALNDEARCAFAVVDEHSGQIIGSTSYHDIIPAARRVEIGYTWYAQSRWRSSVNSTCKYLLLCHAFETLGCATVGWRTDITNTRSQAAIERLGAKKDGIIRGQAARRDGSIRDTVFYSMTRAEWPAAKTRLQQKLRLD